MTKSFLAQCMAMAVVASLVMFPAMAAAQTQQNTPAPAPSSSQPSGTTQAQPASSDSNSSSTAAQPPSQLAAQDTPMPNVKPGSEADVSAIGDRSVGKGLDFYSLEKEIALGKQLAQEVDKSAKFIDDPVVDEYVNRIGQNLVRNSDARVPFTIKVIDSDTVNAFALPGGFFYVNSGLILHADEEAELAGVMAHEIAHVCARHGTKQATKGDIMQMASIPAMIFIPYSWAGYAIYQGMNFAIPLTFLKFSRNDEREADYLGTQYMYKAGYDPNAFVAFFEKVEADEKKEPGTIPKVFSTHPPTPDRIEAVQKEIATILPPRGQYIVTTSEFDSVKKRLQMIEANIKVDSKNPNKPTLRKRTSQNKGGNPSADTGGSNTQTSGSDQGSDDDSDRPTLKRRPDDNTNDNTSQPNQNNTNQPQ
ncbi:MAG TPA: M48 family metallopeptidase [Candidatus Acidoferrales bacterium]|jgi:predicted Zn-dependent protease|nr:M48 family metallopeptidase [Candidatus Acidoferrales bacterium]